MLREVALTSFDRDGQIREDDMGSAYHGHTENNLTPAKSVKMRLRSGNTDWLSDSDTRYNHLSGCGGGGAAPPHLAADVGAYSCSMWWISRCFCAAHGQMLDVLVPQMMDERV